MIIRQSPLRPGVRFTLITDPYQVYVVTHVDERWIYYRPEHGDNAARMRRRDWLHRRKELLSDG